MNCDEVIRRLAEHRIDLGRFGISSLALFGSVARNDDTSTSDIEILVDFSRIDGLFEFVRP